MKHLLILTSLLISGSLWASPMDDICSVNTSDSSHALVAETISKCERNNILYVISSGRKDFEFDIKNKYGEKHLGVAPLDGLIRSFCRYDRNLNRIDEEYAQGFDCVLYDNKPREYIDLRK